MITRVRHGANRMDPLLIRLHRGRVCDSQRLVPAQLVHASILFESVASTNTNTSGGSCVAWRGTFVSITNTNGAAQRSQQLADADTRTSVQTKLILSCNSPILDSFLVWWGLSGGRSRSTFGIAEPTELEAVKVRACSLVFGPRSARASIGACVEGVPRVRELSLVAHVPRAHEIEGREGQQCVDCRRQDTA